MNPYKIFSMTLPGLLFFGLVYNGKFHFESDSIFVLIFDNVFSFIFPAIIFFSAWIISYMYKKKNSTISNYYIKVLINFVLPYFICMVPYIIYQYGINSLNYNEVIRILLEGNITKSFTYIKTLIGLALVFPAAEYFIKKNTKVTLITSLALSAIFSLFNLGYINILNYLIYLSLGISFSYYKKELVEFFRKNHYPIYYYYMWSVILMIGTNLKICRFLNPIAEVLYSITIIFLITYYCYKIQGVFYRKRNFLHTKLIFNPPIIGISIFLLAEIILDIINDIANAYILTIPGVFVYYAGSIFIIFLFVIEKTQRRIEEERLERRRLLFK